MTFYKYQATGNDFIFFFGNIILSDKQITFLCNRKFGIGADGVIIIKEKEGFDFEMIFYNPDGSQSFCGNGTRCAVMFAKKVGLINNSANLFAFDGKHSAIILDDNKVKLNMSSVSDIEVINNNSFFLDTGSPHFVKYSTEIDSNNFIKKCKEIRYNSRFSENGVNVNFISKYKTGIKIRTYERGVENETLSCGTGVTAAALVYAKTENLSKGIVDIYSKGGELQVEFNSSNDSFYDIYLIGSGDFVFKGEINV